MPPQRARRVVVVTGASAGVGRAAVRAFAAGGDDVALLARGEERLAAAAREVEAAGRRALVAPVDVADAAAVEAAADRIESELGPIDVWVNNAMASVFSPVAEMEADEYRRVTEVTYLGGVHGTLAALRRMRPRDRGVVVQVGSALAYRSVPLQSAYCAAKAALRGFTDSVRTELMHDGSGVAITMVHLPALNTPQFRWVRSRLPREAQPVPPIYQPEVAAEAIHWASHHPRREVNVGWPAEFAILGQKLVPGFMDAYMATSAWEGQMTDEPRDSTRPDNLWEPAPGDQEARGVFDDRAAAFSPHLWAATHRAIVGGAAATGLVVAGALAALRRR